MLVAEHESLVTQVEKLADPQYRSDDNKEDRLSDLSYGAPPRTSSGLSFHGGASPIPIPVPAPASSIPGPSSGLPSSSESSSDKENSAPGTCQGHSTHNTPSELKTHCPDAFLFVPSRFLPSPSYSSTPPLLPFTTLISILSMILCESHNPLVTFPSLCHYPALFSSFMFLSFYFIATSCILLLHSTPHRDLPILSISLPNFPMLCSFLLM